MIFGLLRSTRPRQWTKNLLVFAGYLFTLGEPREATAAWRALLAFCLFCIASGAVYLTNDILDASRDRHHPTKGKRPIASGLVPIRTASGFAVVLVAAAVFGAFWLDYYGLALAGSHSHYFGLTLLAYLFLTSAYSLKLKHLVIVDLFVIAAGFVIRAVAGAVVIDVSISPWLLLCTTLLALFLGLAKRRHELVTLERNATNHRKILDEYSIGFLDQMINITAATALMAYSLYTFAPFSKTASQHPYMMVTIPFVTYGIFRYLYLIHTRNAGGQPELVLLEDKPLLINIILWAGVVALILKLG